MHAASSPDTSPRSAEHGIALACLLTLLAVHLWLGGRRELAADEALYWVFSRKLDSGYLDHPPAIAWVIAASTRLLGDTELGVRAGTAVLGSLGLVPAILLARDRALAAFLLAASPMLWLGGVLATPDVPLLAAWSLGLWAAARERWWLLGIAAGLAMLSKYTGVLLLPLLLLGDPKGALRRGPWIAVAIAFVVYLPNALWNVEHDYVSWRFQLDHVSGEGTAAGAGSLAFVGAQALMVGPLILLTAGLWWLRHVREAVAFSDEDGRIDRLCWWTSLPLLVIATISGGEANWAAPAWIGALVGLARMGGRWSRIAWFGGGISAVISLALTAHAITPLANLEGDPLHRLEGGRILGDSVAAWGVQPVYTARYQEAALIHFYSGIPAHALPDHGRADQYDLWPAPGIAAAPGQDVAKVLFVRPWRAGTTIALDDLGWQRGPPNVVTAYAATTDPTISVPVARWQVFEAWRAAGPQPGATGAAP